MDTLIILSPLVVGYFIKITAPQWLQRINHSLTLMIYLILLLMGMNLAGLDNLQTELSTLIGVTSVLVGLTLITNLLALPLVDKWLPLAIEPPLQSSNTWALMRESIRLAAVVAAGFCLGLVVSFSSHALDQGAMAILMVILLLIGMQMRASNISFRQILLSPRGLAIAALILLSSLAAGALTALCFNFPIHHGLALASGLGWYSLSGALISQELGPLMGSIAFLADLSRELIAIILIPLIMPRAPATAIGYGGATAMDFTLPIIQKSGGSSTVPIAIVSGFLLSMAGPILIPLFLSWG